MADILAPTLAVGLCLGRIGCFLNGCCYGQVACPDCPVAGVSFPLSAPPRYELVENGYQTPAGFTLAPRPAPEGGAVVDRVRARFGRRRPGAESGRRDRAGRRPEDRRAWRTSISTWATSGSWPRGKNDLTLDGAHRRRGAANANHRARGRSGCTRRSSTRRSAWRLLFLLLSAYYPFRRHDGQVMALMMIGYSMHRYVNELLRADERPKGFESGSPASSCSRRAWLLWLWLARRPAQYRLQTEEAAAPRMKPAAVEAVRPAAVTVMPTTAATTATSTAAPGRCRRGR